MIQIGHNLFSGRCEKRTNHSVSTNVRHARHPSQPSATQQPHEHRFRLVIGGMTNGNPVCPYLVSQLRHEVIARGARRGLNRRVLSSLDQQGSMNDELQLSFSTILADKRFVTVGLRSSQPIITMGNRQREPPRPSQTMEERQ